MQKEKIKLNDEWLLSNGLYKCPYCNKEYKKFGICTHIWKKHTEEGINFEINNPIKGWNRGLTKETNKGIKDSSRKRSENYSGENAYWYNKQHSEESKLKMSIKRKEYLKNNKSNNGWSIYSNQENIPERNFRLILETIDNINAHQYYMPKESERGFEIDFAIPDKKIGFEINGNQHYDKEGNLLEYYQNRHNYLEDLGWNIIEIHYLICFDNEKIKKIILETFNNNITFSQDMCNELLNDRILKKKEKENLKLEKQKNKQEFIENRINLIINSGIDFSKYGWVSKVAKILNITPQKVTPWIKNHMSEFYINKCFKKN